MIDWTRGMVPQGGSDRFPDGSIVLFRGSFANANTAAELLAIVHPEVAYQDEKGIASPDCSEILVSKIWSLGYWCQERNPFDPREAATNSAYWCGFTPHGATGFNGRPDFSRSARTRALARYRAALDCLLHIVAEET